MKKPRGIDGRPHVTANIFFNFVFPAGAVVRRAALVADDLQNLPWCLLIAFDLLVVSSIILLLHNLAQPLPSWPTTHSGDFTENNKQLNYSEDYH